MNRPTARILHVACPVCDAILAIHVKGLSPMIGPDEWLATLDAEDLQYVHAEHVRVDSPAIDPPRARTRRLT